MNSSYETPHLANTYADFKLSDELNDLYVNKLRMPVQLARMMMFANEAKFTNDTIDYWMSFKPARQEDESHSDYKNRRAFQNKLLKYRSELYDYSVYLN
jgi:hypothetical protein